MVYLKKYCLLALGFVVSICFLWLAFRNVPFSGVVSYFVNVNYYLIFVAVFIIILSFFLRAVRWHILLSKKETLLKTFHILMTGFMLNCIIPGRAGEVARPAIISRNPLISFPEALSTVAVERLFDLMMILALFSAVLFFIHIPEDLSYNFGKYVLNRQLLLDFVSKFIIISIILAGGLFFILFERSRNLFFIFINQIELSISKFSKKNEIRFKKYFSSLVKSFINNFAKGTVELKNTFSLIKISLLSFAIWFLQICSYFLIVKASAGIDINFVETAFVMIVICFFIAIPSVPGFWGVWEAGGIFAMAVLGISKIDAAGFNLFNHAVQMIPVILSGIISAWFVSFRYERYSQI